MDAQHFDTLARALSEAGTRRGLLGLLATLPVLSGLFALLDPDEAEAKRRRKRRKKRHKHGKGRDKGKHKKRKCQAHSKTKTCAGKCAQVKNNCKKTVDCGSCECPEPCGDCFICQEQGPNTPTHCMVDPEQVGDPCGSDGETCQANGACVCIPADPCTAGVCGTVPNNCGQDVNCGGCSNPTPICASNVCTTCSSHNPCPTGQCCGEDGSCGACLVFASSTEHFGNLGGLTGADAICQDLAADAGLPGAYKAWLSDSTGSPSSRFTQATVPYHLVNGTPIADNWADLTDGTLDAPIEVTETGDLIGLGVWSNTNTDGTALTTSDDCEDWSLTSVDANGRVGLSDRTNSDWTVFRLKACGPPIPGARLYCFQQA